MIGDWLNSAASLHRTNRHCAPWEKVEQPYGGKIDRDRAALVSETAPDYAQATDGMHGLAVESMPNAAPRRAPGGGGSKDAPTERCAATVKRSDGWYRCTLPAGHAVAPHAPENELHAFERIAGGTP